MMAQSLDALLHGFHSDLSKILPAKKKITAKWLLVNCIDCRYPHLIHDYMNRKYPGQLYDHLVLAGASLAVADSYTDRDYWSKTFLEHVDLSIDLHDIHGVLILDHRTCGAFREFKLLTAAQENTKTEVRVHRAVAETAVALSLSRFRRKKHAGIVQVYLTPEVEPGDTDFSSPPILLHGGTA
jgi:hypothetical protein